MEGKEFSKKEKESIIRAARQLVEDKRLILSNEEEG